MSFKHIRIEFSIDIEEHKRDLQYQQAKAIESLEKAIKHIKENGLKRTLQFDDDAMIDLWLVAYTRQYAFPTSSFKAIRNLVKGFDTSVTKADRMRYKEAYERKNSNVDKL